MDEYSSTQPTQIADTWERGDPYEQYIGRWSRQVAPRFLSWMGCSGGLTWYALLSNMVMVWPTWLVKKERLPYQV